jgi:hypothetical protein
VITYLPESEYDLEASDRGAACPRTENVSLFEFIVKLGFAFIELDGMI